ncbi:LOW QUALITY PROTEIN: DNA repair protein XRCC1 [Papilio machaon]|uniref:LOW QUALITY PROTEIN: DNA repair protein XRCC1 n=1 Tax=Papilio machaon TaxID=76193 RepID=UPI001E663EED|nr:LOW QUALITY PROTEIN: DNA repair protein XRCC1 [Papilio machaon]
MPRVKIDYVVSVSSEDPDHPASNLLASEVSKRRWLCSAGAGEGAVLLQLQRAVTICGVHIGAHQAAFVEVLVGTADRPVDQYEVLVPRCMFSGPAECRRAGAGAAGAASDRVRSFNVEQLAEGARRRRWDRVRLLCSQPYNKHCQFGLSFIHIYEPEPQPPPRPQPPETCLSLGNYSSDEDEFRPGALFAKYRQSLKQNDDNVSSCNSDAQIRKASAQALKNIPDADTRLKKTAIESGGERTPRRAAAGDQREVLRGVVFALSGFVNPQRAALRDLALALGARYRPDWTPDCTHLVCAFPNTPKLKKVVASAPHAHVVSADWLHACQRTRRREPEAPHAPRAPHTPRAPRHKHPAPSPAPPRAPRTHRGSCTQLQQSYSRSDRTQGK